MTTTSRMPAVIDALVSTLTAALPAAQIIDGPPVTTPDGDYLSVGWTPTGETPRAVQAWSPYGNNARDEVMDIPCYCDSYSGDTEAAPRRTAAYGLFAAVEVALRGSDPNNPPIGAALAPAEVEITSHEVYQEQTEKGLAVGVVFHVQVTSRNP